MTFPFILSKLEVIGAFCLYAGFNVLAFIMIFLWVPETMQRTLEELDWVFAVPVREFAAYQVGTVLPWWIKKYILFQHHATKEPLYHFEKVPMTARRNSVAKQHPAGCDNELKR